MLEDKFLEFVENHHSYRVDLMKRGDKKRVASSPDRLYQFKRIAEMRKCSTPSAAVDLCTKQFTDILDMADGTHPMSGDIIYLTELIADVQNYLDLTLACAEEEWKSNPSQPAKM